MEAGRNANGTFKKGHNGGGRGRPTREMENSLLERFKGNIKPEDMDEITKKLITQAKDGHLQSMRLLFSYLFGLPRQAIEVDAIIKTGALYTEALDVVYATVEETED